MDMLIVRGGERLSGCVPVSGAKNSALPLMAAALACEGETVLRSIPNLVDVSTQSQVLGSLGMQVDRDDAGALHLKTVDETSCIADYELVRRMRASVCVLGPLLAKRRMACVSLPGGCNIGDRPIDLHLKGLAALGAQIRVERGYVIARADRLRGANIFLGGAFGSTVTGTCNVMIAATLAQGTTTIESAACEPEVVDVGNFLNAAGAKIEGLGTPFLKIEGVDQLQGVEHEVIPDRIEVATLMIAAAITGGEVRLNQVRPDHITAIIEKLRDIGVQIELESPEQPARKQTILVKVVQPLKSVDCIALPYPGIPTDVQAQLMSLLACVPGISIVTDKVFPDRFMHASELARMGARIRRESASAILNGVTRLSGACVMASDLRASAALVLAGLAAEGETVIRRIYHLDRGYENLEEKLISLGAQVQRVKDEPNNMPESLKLTDDESRPSYSELMDALTGPHWNQSSSVEPTESSNQTEAG
ncbi:MAG: UDP-N-acetylglucosamine 1-carboxyvinyltransferase [Planctomycetes bacterium]|nr:UDP-N-acetylglucosamine 1-carboxyvinyltransferase [Planctomycetota bacterium]MCH9724441.1 UDP-N-acetylglucosamine 1-carboxyvinyltransferase [Planctomycetota bacterium]MCH9778183.1 UDP-N-acetylglucosamine 1-carboxyvinyltransferase [Planctomycetota bacterium]MCH9793406.1 UDP-N-acetylglucosamine 1-carboxyvinyltransferase [Planctomycetota bacterium]MDF1744689.1 UDP-N-acetylglucosamine 1-carboxyvinyltransferase [Gimesia sp.]